MPLAGLFVKQVSESGCNGGTGAAGGPESALAKTAIPATVVPVFHAAEREYGVPWNVLAGINKVETDFGRLEATGVTSGENFAGAGGPMQFLAGTWASYGVDGNRDGRVSRYDPRDAIPAAARYLHASGAPGDWQRALFAYNHAGWYVAHVAQRAAPSRAAAHADTDGRSGGASDRRVAETGTPSLPTRPPGPIAQTRADHQARP